MKFKMKATVAALAMMAAGGANAAINPGSVAAGAGGQGELYFSVFDAVNKISYSRDLGVTINQFLASPSAPMSFAADTKLQSFISTASASSSTLVWNLLGAMDSDFTNPADFPKYGLYMTSNSSNAQLSAIDFTQAANGIANIGFQVNGVNGDAQAQGGGSMINYAANNSSTSTSGYGYYNGPAGGSQLGSQIAVSGAKDEANIGQSMAFYQVGLSLDATGTPTFDAAGNILTSVTKYGDWTLAANGDLSYGTSAGGTAPVPLPPAVLLLGSALAGLVGVSRRRQQDEALSA